MYCGSCGNTLEDHFRYCSRCGAPTENAAQQEKSAPQSGLRLTRPREGRKIGGVCAGVARYLDLDVTLVRIAWLLLAIFPPVPGFVAYIICWIIMPQDPFPAPPEVSTVTTQV